MPTAETVREVLDHSNISNLADAFKAIKLGELIAGLIPRWISKSGLSSSATQIHYATDGVTKEPFIVLAVNLSDNTPLAIVNGGVGAGEVGIAYDADGVPTFTFASAQTAYKVLGFSLPTNWSTILAGALS